MAKSENQKLKLLYILKYLYEYTDEQHTVTVNDIIGYLARNDIIAERRTIYDDLRLLSEFGVDIVKRKSKTHDYFIGNRLFELAEVKILIDCIQASKFITKKKSAALIKKLESLAGKYQASTLGRQVFLAERVKNMNESVYYTVDAIHRAISENRKITFQYFDYNNIKKVRVYRKNGQVYISNPIALTYDNGNYYLIDFNEKHQSFLHYRVDRMCSINVTDEKRVLPKERFDVADYVRKMFSMFGGTVETVTARFSNSLLGSVADKFGSDMTVLSDDGENFVARFNVAVSSSFTSWFIGFGSKAEILSPQSLRDDLSALGKEIVKLYKPNAAANKAVKPR